MRLAFIASSAMLDSLNSSSTVFMTPEIIKREKSYEYSVTHPLVEGSPLKYKKKNFYYIKLHSFRTILTEELLKNYVEKAEKRKSDGIILDLRGNPGGLACVFQEACGLFLQRGSYLFVMRERGKRDKTLITKNYQITKLPLTLLIDEGSASASELMAAAMVENSRATLVGTTTAGAVEVGNTLSLPCKSGMVIASQEALTPYGLKIIEGVGVSPDVEVRLTKEDIKKGNDSQLQKATEVLANSLEK